MQVAEIMDRDAVTVAPGTPIQDVLALMKDNELPGLPVVNEAGRCVGIVTESDLVLSEEEGDLHMPHHLDIMGGTIWLESWKHFEERLEKAMAADVDEMMTADPVTVSPETSVKEAGRIIAEQGHNRLPVVEHGRFVGLVTRLDVLEAMTRE
ncbi:CBS domain-containing protein [Svornostia abyssi]|uniref:CBS domain-containing protein n=1 Tax=Svornostia abyssi TaxID=2898438 RepID=A0ABY5PET0_9ACTN|nr:CBS domain-containing protein [Parviterribacteraceae bacterium J379]